MAGGKTRLTALAPPFSGILKPLAATAWGTKDFSVEDPEGYIIGFGGAS